MNDEITTAATTQQYPITDLINAINAMNPIVAATGIIVFGIIAGSYIWTSAKYNRDTELKYKDLHLHIGSLNPVFQVAPVQS